MTTPVNSHVSELGSGSSSTDKFSDDYKPGQHSDCNLMRNFSALISFHLGKLDSLFSALQI